MRESSDRVLWLAAALACLPCLALPLTNTDLFWHLSAARAMAASRAVPSADWLSWTMAGEPWADFEWLSQLVYGAVWALGGMRALWTLKVGVLLASFALVDRLLRLHGLASLWRACALAAWACLMLPRSDLRPDLFSVLLFGWLLHGLERRRLGRGEGPGPAACAAVFALWSNLHAGFPYGIALLGLYAAADLAEGRRPRWACLCAAAAGTFVNPLGWGSWRVLAEHAGSLASLSRHIVEWGPVPFGNPWRWPHGALVVGAASAAWLAVRPGKVPAAPIALLAGLAWAGTAHQRLGVYFAQAGLPLTLHLLKGAGVLPRHHAAAVRRGALVFLLGAAGFLGWCVRDTGVFKRLFEARHVPVLAAAFLEREAGELGGRPLYNLWQWGGYLGWRLAPRYRVFQDGRYLFHGLLAEEAAASVSAEAWRAFLDRRGVEVALMPNVPRMLAGRLRRRDGTEKEVSRPYYVSFLPKEDWALVHFDEQALVFARRRAVGRDWLAAREYKLLRPGDAQAFREAVESGEVSRDAADDEYMRYGESVGELAAAGSGW